METNHFAPELHIPKGTTNIDFIPKTDHDYG